MMRRYFSILLLFAISFSACRYKDGPKFTIRSAKARITGIWKMDKYYDNGVDNTTNFNNLSSNWQLEIKDDNNYILTYNLFALSVRETGVWSFNDDKTEFNLKKDGTGSNIWKITRLKSKEMWAEQTDSKGHLIQYRMKSDK